MFGGDPACAKTTVQRSQWDAVTRPRRPGINEERLGQQVRLGFECIVCGNRDRAEQRGHEPAERFGDCNVDSCIGRPYTEAAVKQAWPVLEASAPQHTGRW